MSASRQKGPPLLVETPAELRHAGRSGRPIVLAGWTSADRESQEKVLTKWSLACGCDTGAAVMSIATLAVIAMGVIDVLTHGLGALGAAHAGALVAAIIGGALVGKMIGLGWAEMQWRRAVEAAVASYEPPRGAISVA